MSEVLVVARACIRAEKVDEFGALCAEVARVSRRDDGCIEYALYRSFDDPRVVCSVERWRDAAAMGAHMAAPHTQAFLGRVPEFVTEAPTITVYDATTGRLLG